MCRLEFEVREKRARPKFGWGLRGERGDKLWVLRRRTRMKKVPERVRRLEGQGNVGFRERLLGFCSEIEMVLCLYHMICRIG